MKPFAQSRFLIAIVAAAALTACEDPEVQAERLERANRLIAKCNAAAPGATYGVVGRWEISTASSLDTEVFTFRGDGNWESRHPSGGPSLEGTWSQDGASLEFSSPNGVGRGRLHGSEITGMYDGFNGSIPFVMRRCG